MRKILIKGQIENKRCVNMNKNGEEMKMKREGKSKQWSDRYRDESKNENVVIVNKNIH